MGDLGEHHISDRRKKVLSSYQQMRSHLMIFLQCFCANVTNSASHSQPVSAAKIRQIYVQPANASTQIATAFPTSLDVQNNLWIFIVCQTPFEGCFPLQMSCPLLSVTAILLYVYRSSDVRPFLTILCSLFCCSHFEETHFSSIGK